MCIWIRMIIYFLLKKIIHQTISLCNVWLCTTNVLSTQDNWGNKYDILQKQFNPSDPLSIARKKINTDSLTSKWPVARLEILSCLRIESPPHYGVNVMKLISSCFSSSCIVLCHSSRLCIALSGVWHLPELQLVTVISLRHLLVC